jgi:nicotinamide mononucleotide adenylyltransferase
MKNKKYAMFVGRYQPLHDGHKYLFIKKIEEGIPVLIAIRDVPTDEKNPFTAQQVLENVSTQLIEHIKSGMLKVMIIPDIEGVYYGRDVGYKVEQIEVPDHIKEISATKIRKEMGL